jgi:transposase
MLHRWRVLKPARRPLPEHLPRETVNHPTACACPSCGGGEDVTDVLDYRPASFRVIRHVRVMLSCRTWEMITQAPVHHYPSAVAGRAPHCWRTC